MKTYDLGEDKARFSVVSFNTVATTRVPWSYNAAVINAGIDQMSATGKTSISDGFVAAGKLFADDSRDAKKIVLLLSDGEQTVDAAGTYVKCADDNAECHRSKMQIAIDAAALVKGDEVTVFAWGFGESMSDVWKEGLQQIATEPSKATLVKDLTELTSYLVGLEATVCTESTPSGDPISVHGDPKFQHNGKGQHFWLKEGVLSPLLEWKSDDGHKMSLQGLTVANTETGHQWFKQIALVRDGMKFASSEVVFGDKPTLALSTLDNTTVVTDTFSVGHDADAKDVTTVAAGGMTFELTAESAHKFDDAEQQMKYAHINVKMPHGLVKGATGLFAELAGAQPMSEATKALLRSPE